ncbi:adenylate/guanylate cyclase domain-containing protein [Maridesulfovibrio zosterae]|uniref:adenylate/guanylate cyclase domain-containing protein n=1 Tax=Maridesulfovibrio zosterae TaxID=82171 RepID=UPI00146D7584|nr:adenylate/guanylate cyclase domain-containing protein [Maridesulfovibrio zosterae]
MPNSLNSQTRFRITAQCIGCFFIAASLLIGGAFVLYFYKANEVEGEIRTHIKEHVDSARKLILAEFGEPVSEILYLASLSEVTEAFTGIISSESLADLLSLSKIKKKYDQIRLVDRYGMEVVRINYNDGVPVVAPDNKLQFVGMREYFLRAKDLKKNQVYVSPLDLNIENGKVEIPVKPMIRMATPLFDAEGKRRGLAILNYFGRLLLSSLKNNDSNLGEELFLLNKDGYYLFSPNPEKNWGFMIKDRADDKFQTRFPHLWTRVKNDDSGQVVNGEGLFSFATVKIGSELNDSSVQIISDAGNWKIVSFVPEESITVSTRKVFQDILGFVVVLIFVAAAICIALSRLRFSKAKTETSVLEMTKSYERFVPREFLHLLKKERYRDITLESNVRMIMGILFSDIRSYTHISESREPEEVLSFLNQYFQAINPAISQNRGFVDSFHGDALLALFQEKPDHAVKAAVDMRVQLAKFNQDREENDEERVDIGVGIHFGEVTLGTVGTTYRMQATVIGDAVNLAARIESVTKMFKIGIVVTGAALENMENPESFCIREIDTVRVKGKEHPVVLYEVFDNDSPEVRKAKSEMKDLMEQGLLLYKKGDFQKALDVFKICADACPEDSIPPIYIKRCSTFLRVPPGAGWTGVSSV